MLLSVSLGSAQEPLYQLHVFKLSVVSCGLNVTIHSAHLDQRNLNRNTISRWSDFRSCLSLFQAVFTAATPIQPPTAQGLHQGTVTKNQQWKHKQQQKPINDRKNRQFLRLTRLSVLIHLRVISWIVLDWLERVFQYSIKTFCNNWLFQVGWDVPCLSWCIIRGQSRSSMPTFFTPHFIIHTLAFTDSPRCGGWGVEGWPLLIQRLGICIWLLFVNQWCECAGRRVSPRLSLSGQTQTLWEHNYTQKPNAKISCSHMKPL